MTEVRSAQAPSFSYGVSALSDRLVKSAVIMSSGVQIPHPARTICPVHTEQVVFAFLKLSSTVLSSYTVFDAPWCNGNTTVFGAVIPGSSPGGGTNSTRLCRKNTNNTNTGCYCDRRSRSSIRCFFFN